MAKFLKYTHGVPFTIIPRNKIFSGKRSTPAEYCLNLVKTHDYENFLCSLLLPKVIRSAAFAVRAFNIELARIADQTNESTIAAMRIKFWEEIVDNVYMGKPPEHPVAQELSRIVNKHRLLKKQLKRLVVARSKISNNFKNMEMMEKYAEESVSPTYYLILQAAGIKDMQADHVASHIGKAQGLTNIIRALPYNLERKQLLLPLDICVKHSVSQEDFFRQQNSAGVRQVVYDVASSAILHIRKARSLRNDIPKEALPIFLPAVTLSTYLEKLRECDFQVFSPFLQWKNAQLGFRLFLRKMLSNY